MKVLSRYCNNDPDHIYVDGEWVQVLIMKVIDEGDIISVESGAGCGKKALLYTMKLIAQEKQKKVKAKFKGGILAVSL